MSGRHPHMSDRYALSREESVFLARRTLVEHIWHGARLEGCNVTFPDTLTIIDGMVPAGLSTDDVTVVLNLREAWRFLLSSLDDAFGPELVRGLNARVVFGMSLDPGEWRTGSVGIGGAEWRPPAPDENSVARVFELGGESVTERALGFAVSAMRAQLFWHGNKRTAMLAANHLMLAAGAGMLSIPPADLETFNRTLSAYYTTGDETELLGFLYARCVAGLDLGARGFER